MLDKLRKPGTVIPAPEAVAKTVSAAAVIRKGESRDWESWKIEAVPMCNLKRGPAAESYFQFEGS